MIVSHQTLVDIAGNDELIEIGRKAIEDVLIEWRDGRLSEPMRGNGLVVREKDGSNSSIIRMGPERALVVGLLAMAEHRKTIADGMTPDEVEQGG